MKNLFEKTDTEELLLRIDQLTPDSRPLWGKMNVAQMMAHCSVLLRIARGLDNPKRKWLGIVLGWMIKDYYFGKKTFPRNSPTDPSFIVADERIFADEKQKLIEHIRAFHEGGAQNCTIHPNPFFGRLTPEEWARGQYKHIDHHLRQFGV